MLKIIKTKSHRIFEILGIKIKLKRKFHYNKKYLKELLKQISPNIKNYLYLDWPFGSYVFEEMEKANYEKINLIKFSLFELFHCKNRFEVWDFIDVHNSQIENLLKKTFNNKHINGFLVTLDWNEHHQFLIRAFKNAKVPTICIIHESVFQDKDLYYDSKVPISDMVLTWGDLTRNLFIERGYDKNKIKNIGSIKLNAYKKYFPAISKEEFYKVLNLDINKQTILYCCQLCDFQWGDQDFALNKQREAIADLINITSENNFNLIIRNAPAHPELILPKEFKQKYTNFPNIVFDGEDTLSNHRSSYKTKAEDSIYYADMVAGMNSTMQLEASILNKPAIIIKYFNFKAKWNDELGLPICHNKTELKSLILENINNKNNLTNKSLFENFCKNYGFSYDEQFCPLKNARNYLIKGIN